MKNRTMETVDIRKLLRRWFESELEKAPAEDPRRTPECLRFADVSRLARDENQATPAQQEHVAQCVWCQRALSVARRTAGPPTDTAPRAVWSEELKAYIQREGILTDEEPVRERETDA
jgi:hypothetical protein